MSSRRFSLVLAVCLAAGGISASAWATESVSPDELPEPVLDAIRSAVGPGELGLTERDRDENGHTIYRAYFRVSGTLNLIIVAEDGHVIAQNVL